MGNKELNLDDLGFSPRLEQYISESNLESFEIGRVIEEHKERYVVKTVKGEFEAEITGNMRFTAQSREDFPAVGDWVALKTYDSESAIIYHILPRFSIIKRQASGHSGEVQVIATNIDYAFVVQSLDRDFNINRLERYLTICYSAKVSPIIILSKTDLIEEHQVSDICDRVKQRVNDVPVFAISNETQNGCEAIKKMIEKGKTYCMLGSSGVGKSTLLNNLSGKTIMKTDTISQSSNRGRHITSHRELIILDNGAIIVDNPGMREVGLADTSSGLETTFDRIVTLALKCKFKDCTHTSEKGCAVVEAVEKGELDRSSYSNYLKLEREKLHFESTVAERRKKEKVFGKMVKNYYNQKQKGKL